jgi:O-antigen/teichoic acid export membrane protein
MQPLIRRAMGSSFLRHNVVFFTGSTLVSFLNYLYYPVLGRLMSPADFGEVQTITSFFLQAAVFLSVLALTTIRVLKKYEGRPEREDVVSEIEWLAVLTGLVLFGLMLVFAGPLQQFFRFTSVVPFILLALTFLAGIPLAFSNSYLQGHHRFAALSRSNVAGAASKLVLSAGLVLAGLQAVGAILGLFLSQLINLGYTHWQAAKVGRPNLTFAWRLPRLGLIRPELQFAGLILITSLSINTLLSLDIIAVKHYFDPRTAGLYAAIATVARIIFFLTGPLAAVLVASVRLDDPAHNRALLKRSLGLVAGLGGSALVFFALFPYFTVRLLMGPSYTHFSYLLPPLSLAIFLLSLSNLFIYYHVMLRGLRIAVAAATGLITMVIMLMLHHKTVADVVTTMLAGSFLLFILIIIVVNLKRRGGTHHRGPAIDKSDHALLQRARQP